jgi:hypothetical protein
MTSEMGTPMREEGLGQAQGANGSDLQGLLQHRGQVQLRISDLRVQLAQLQEQKDMVGPGAKVRFNQPIADATHQLTAAQLDYDALSGRIAALRAAQTPVATTVQRVRAPVITRQEAEKAGVGAFLLMFPLVLALARRIWVRGGAAARPAIDLESSPRLRRLEEAIEAISIEVERIGEGQRFATRLLSERHAEPLARRATPPESPAARRSPGTITPH